MTIHDNSKHTPTPLRRIAIMATLILAGEAIFLLPFILPRVFRPTLMEVFDLTNLELGVAFSVYGIVAIIAYLFGGPVADRYPARYLMSIALGATGAGGLYLVTIPSFTGLCFVYGFWGVTTILLFWSSMLRATRVWGGEDRQGLAYGLLDGGRGLAGAVIASASVLVFSSMLDPAVEMIITDDKREALIRVIWIFTATVMAVALLILMTIPGRRSPAERETHKFNLARAFQAVRHPAVWLNALIVMCAYVAFKSIDDLSLYANVVHGRDDVDAAGIGTLALWMRPAAALIAGVLADRFRASWIVMAGFACIVVGCAVIASGTLPPGAGWSLVATIIALTIGIYAVRGIYFALVAESGIPVAVTGTAIGFISAVGFLPDVFMGPVSGYLLDYYPGESGHQLLFAFVALFAIIGLIASWHFNRVVHHRNMPVNDK